MLHLFTAGIVISLGKLYNWELDYFRKHPERKDRYTELEWVVYIMMAQTKGVRVLIIEIRVFYKKSKTFSPCFYEVINTCQSFEEL